MASSSHGGHALCHAAPRRSQDPEARCSSGLVCRCVCVCASKVKGQGFPLLVTGTGTARWCPSSTTVVNEERCWGLLVQGECSAVPR
jgi:hypothetical protein